MREYRGLAALLAAVMVLLCVRAAVAPAQPPSAEQAAASVAQAVDAAAVAPEEEPAAPRYIEAEIVSPAASGTQAEAAAQDEDVPELHPEVTDTAVRQRLVVIDPGHQAEGNFDTEPIGPGASEQKIKVATGTHGVVSGLQEYELTLQISLLLQAELEARGYAVALTRAAHTARGRLSPERVRALYGKRLYLSASKAERFSACRYAYFLQYGLKARPRRPAAFNPPEIGTFFHYVLQHTAQDVTDAGGFAAVTDEQLGRFTDRWTQRYIHDELNDFQEKSARFTYLFRRLCQQVRQVVADMAHELRAGDFVPLDFELNFADPEQIAPITLSDGEVTLNMSGVADRVDGWLHDGKLYLRVVDYKTGRKAFSLSDVWYGMGLQMLLYLFALERSGPARYGHEIVPAGVLYVPARDVLIPADRRLSPEEAAKEHAGAVRRSGLLLDDAAVLHAMEHSDTPQYLPVSPRRKTDALASAEQLGLLARHIETTLLDLAHELRGGSITADPYFRSGQDTACTHCDYLTVCHFTPGAGGDCHRVLTKLPADKVWSNLKGGAPDA